MPSSQSPYVLVGALALLGVLLSGCGDADWECFGDGQAECAGSPKLCEDIRAQCLQKLQKLGQPTYDQARFQHLAQGEQDRRSKLVMAHGEDSTTADVSFTKLAVTELKSGSRWIPIVAVLVTIYAVVAAWFLFLRKKPQASKRSLEASSVEPLQPGAKTLDKKKQFDSLMASLNMSADTPQMRSIRVALEYGAKPCLVILASLIWIVKKLVALYQVLPHNVLQMIFGMGLCFFGGVYFTTVAAVEALINFGGDQLWAELKVLYTDCCQISDASEADDKVDADKDGVADVQQISYSELLSRKATVAMLAVEDPERLVKALTFFMTAHLSVIATLKLEFARTVTLCLAVGDMLKVPVCYVFVPPLKLLSGRFSHWVEPVLMTTVKMIAVAVACYVQATISAFYSAIRGGRLFAVGLINFMGANGYMDKLPCVQKPFDADKSYLDEMIAYPVAAIGFVVQLLTGFSLVFPLNLILLPCTIVEWTLRWEVFTS